MRLGTLETGSLALWAAVVLLAAALNWSGRRHALEAFGASAAKERRTALAAGAIPLASLLLALLLVGVSFAAAPSSVDGVPPARGSGGPWALVALWLVLANATVAMVCCALIVIGMLRGTSNGHVLAGDALTAVAGLVSLWAVAANLAPA